MKTRYNILPIEYSGRVYMYVYARVFAVSRACVQRCRRIENEASGRTVILSAVYYATSTVVGACVCGLIADEEHMHLLRRVHAKLDSL